MKITFVMGDDGDSSVGIGSHRESVSFEIHEDRYSYFRDSDGKIDNEMIGYLISDLKKVLLEYTDSGYVRTEKEQELWDSQED